MTLTLVNQHRKHIAIKQEGYLIKSASVTKITYPMVSVCFVQPPPKAQNLAEMPALTHHSPIFYEELPKSKKSMLAKDRLERQKIVMEKVKLCSWCYLMWACVQCGVHIHNVTQHDLKKCQT